jgi:putative tryptophan/tyrosine transport system substrate-binding protein
VLIATEGALWVLLAGMALLAAAAVAWSPKKPAQQRAVPVIAYFDWTSTNEGPGVAAFRQGLADAGYVEGRNVAIEYRWAEGAI